MTLKNKQILITAGPTWVPIDPVRVISNIATGQTGILLAQKLSQLGYQVTLLLGPVEACCIDRKIKLLKYKYFKELKSKLIQELKSRHYDILIHSAAVSDYQPQRVFPEKIESGIKNWHLTLQPTEKIINLAKKIDRSLVLVGFKFEPEAKKGLLIKKAVTLIRNAGLNLVVANTVKKGKYRAYIIDHQRRIHGAFPDRKILAQKLISLLGEGLWKK